MPVAPAVSYPGVYIQEVPSDVRTITPVETATTAFIGRALRGPVNQPVICNSYADFQRVFGGLWLKSSLGYAVNDFFLNGGSKAVIVRLFRPTPGAKEKASLTVKGEVFIAANAVLAAAAEAAKADDATSESVKAAAQKEKAKYDEGPAQDAAQAVLEAINQLAGDADKQAIDQALENIKPDDIAIDGIKSQATAVANAVLAAAKEAAEPADVTGESVKKVAQDEAGKYKDKGPAQDAARVVLTTINQLKDKADKQAIDQALENIEPDAIAEDVAERYPLILEAKHPGAWGNNLCVRITDVDSKVREQLARQYGVKQEDLFNLTVHDRETGATETFPNVTVVAGPRQLDKVLEHESELIAVAEEGLPVQRPLAHPDPEPGKSVWNDPNAHDGVAEEDRATDGKELTADDFKASEAKKEGIYALEHADIFNLLCIPPYTEDDKDLLSVLPAAATYCEKRRAMLLVDPPPSWKDKNKAKDDFPTGFPGSLGNNAAIFFPRIQAPNPLRDNQVEAFAPSGAVAGVFARTDATRGVWKAPAGQEATLRGVVGLSVPLTDAENGELNPLGINCLRQVPAAGYVVWGARTIVGDDRLASQWKYIPVRRTALYIEESLYRGTQWAVFEPNDEPLWSQLRLNIGVFMHGLFRQGAFQGQSPKDAYFVKCDSTTTTQADIDRGIVNIIVGFAPLKPAEFVVLYIQQIAGQLAV
jgi:phage tail sheath protein FI